MIESAHVLALSGALFTIGLLGASLRRHVVAILLNIQLMLAASSVALIGFARTGPAEGLAADPQVFALLIVITSAAEIVVGLAIGTAFVRSRRTLDVDAAREMRW